MNLGKAIKEVRKEKGLSQAELSQVSGLTQAAISNIENGKRPGIETLKKICRALNISEGVLYIMALERDDIPKEKEFLFDGLFPIIQKFGFEIAKK
jgi:transcriptional regulator with XRE-family HTH domain